MRNAVSCRVPSFFARKFSQKKQNFAEKSENGALLLKIHLYKNIKICYNHDGYLYKGELCFAGSEKQREELRNRHFPK